MLEERVKKIKDLLFEVMEEENLCNEGSLSMHYEEIIAELDLINNIGTLLCSLCYTFTKKTFNKN